MRISGGMYIPAKKGRGTPQSNMGQYGKENPSQDVIDAAEKLDKKKSKN